MRPFGPRSSISLLFVAVSALSCAQTKWHTDLGEAEKLAAQTGKPIFVDFYAEWCGPCKMLEQNVFPDGRVKALFGKVICVRLDIDQHEEEAKKYGVSSIPRLMLFSAKDHQTLWDTMGYREADEFVQELSEALHLKAPAAIPAVPEPAPLVKVRAALAKSGGLAQLQATDPANAKAGLRLLVAKLGVYKEADFQSPAALLTSAGTGAVPALIEGMESKTLAVRVGSYKVLNVILSQSKIQRSKIPFDPWATAALRSKQLVAWKRLVL